MGPAGPVEQAGEGETPPDRLRIVSWNVNGLRAVLKRTGHRTLRGFLDSLHGDIVCLQETKLRPSELLRDLAVIDGWDAYYSTSRSGRAHAGVATFVRRGGLGGVVDSQDGFSGVWSEGDGAAGGGGGATDDAGDGGGAREGAEGGGVGMPPALEALLRRDLRDARAGDAGNPPVDRAGSGDPGDLLRDPNRLNEALAALRELDGEGRVAVTRHPGMVLFNVYGPAVTAEDPEAAAERARWKTRFFDALEIAWDAEIAAACRGSADAPRPSSSGRRRAVIVVGDLNVSPEAIDSCDESFFPDRPDRRWLRRLTRPSDGPPRLVDAFRAFHPGLRGAYTCWSTNTGARALNHGTRIDLALCGGVDVANRDAAAGAGGRIDGDDEARSPRLPVTPATDLEHVSARKPAPIALIASDIYPTVKGSDHCPISVDLAATSPGVLVPSLSAAPGSAASLFAGQRTIFGWATGGQGTGGGRLASDLESRGGGSARAPPAPDRPPASGSDRAPPAVPSSRGSGSPSAAARPEPPSRVPAARARGGPLGTSSSGAAKPARAGGASHTLSRYFKPSSGAGREGTNSAASPPTPRAPAGAERPAALPSPREDGARPSSVAAASPASPERRRGDEPGVSSAAGPPTPDPDLMVRELEAAEALERNKTEEARAAWREIGRRMAPPTCRHGEPCAKRRTNKTGENRGRWFYGCARPAGPPPEGNCGFFRWVEAKAKVLGPGGVASRR